MYSKVNGLEVTLPYSGPCYVIDYNGNYVQLTTAYGMSVQFNGYWLVAIQVPDDYKGLTHGMCGNNNDNATDDLTVSNGMYVGNEPDSGTLIGNSYVVPDSSNPDQR
jgi:hypothetical protein